MKCKLLLLTNRDDNFFKNINLLPDDTPSNKSYNLGLIYHRIENYYEYIIKTTLPESYFSPKDDSSDNCVKLGELIAGISAQCNRREYYLNIMNNLNERVSNELMQILLELIPVDDEKESNNSNNNLNKSSSTNKEENENLANENAMLWIRAENAEKECDKLNEEIVNLNNKIAELTKSNYTNELTLKETEAKYQELILVLEKRDNDQRDSQENYVEQMNYSIQLSELRGKLEAKEKSFNQYREEKEKAIEEYKHKIFNLTKENGTLKESCVKYEVLKQQMKKFSMEDMYLVKQKLIQSERSNKEKDEEIKKLRSYDDKNILLKKIEDLNVELTLLNEKNIELQKENESYRYQIISIEKEKNELQAQIESKNIQQNPLIDNESSENAEPKEKDSKSVQSQEKEKTPIAKKDSNTGFTLEKIEEQETQKMRLLEVETKLKVLQTEKDNLTKEKTNLNNDIEKFKKLLDEQKVQLEKLSKKIEKYSQFKKENQTFISKITDLMDKVKLAKNENVQLKNAKVESENSLNDKINKMTKDINESSYKIKDLENQLSFVKKENEKYEELNKSNKAYIEELQKKVNNNPSTDSKLIEVEKKLKELTENENKELKIKIKEKDDVIQKQNEKIKNVDNELRELTTKIEKIPTEFAKRDEEIDFYKTQLEQKEKMYNEEMRILSSLYYSLSSKLAVAQQRATNHSIDLNFN